MYKKTIKKKFLKQVNRTREMLERLKTLHEKKEFGKLGELLDLYKEEVEE